MVLIFGCNVVLVLCSTYIKELGLNFVIFELPWLNSSIGLRWQSNIKEKELNEIIGYRHLCCVFLHAYLKSFAQSSCED